MTAILRTTNPVKKTRWPALTLACMVWVGVTPSSAMAQSLMSLMGGQQEQQAPVLEDIPLDQLLAEENKTSTDRNFETEMELPKELSDLQEIPGYVEPTGDDDKPFLPIDIRKEAQKEAALSYGARGGLAARSYDINEELKGRGSYLEKVFDFRQLLIAGPSGFMIEPPIISESLNALLVENDGQKAAVSDAIYRIHENVKIVTAPRDWHTYLERSWGKVEEPPEILRPKDDEERKAWRINVKKGWDEGIQQANEVFERDLARLLADFDGMVRYRKLLANGMVSPPFAQQIDRGVTAEGPAMRVGDRAVVITGTPQLITETSEWQPASR
ncbi:MAG: type IV secretory system conjugative DNA transfer family protein [Pseudobdellovibrionaceae bacterium]